MTIDSLPENEQPVAHGEEELFRLLVEGITDYAIFMLDPDGYVMTWNQGAERNKGYAPDEIIGKHFSIFYPEADQRAGKPQRILEAARKEGKFEDEGWRVRKDGSRFWASVLITALHAPDGTLRGFAKVTRDMTERREAEEALHQSEERFRLLVENVKDYAIFMLSPEGRVISWNAGARRIKGYTSEEVLGRHFSMFYPAADRESGKPALELEVALAEGRYEEEGWRLRKDGSSFWANVVITPIRNQHGLLVGFAKVTRDMTERRKAREELLATQQEARDLSLSNAAKDEFLGIVAHELRTPITVLFGSAQFLEKRLDRLEAPILRELVGNIAHESDRMRQLVENLLALARPPEPESLNLDIVSLQERTARAIATFEQTGSSRVVSLSAPDAPIYALIEDMYFERIIQNLLSNADKFSPASRGIDVTVSLQQGRPTVEVADRGTGVDAAELSLIFDSFYRSRGASGIQGKGLGLTVCRRLADLMGGEVQAMLRPGGGLIFRLSLPAPVPEDLPAEEEDASTSPVATSDAAT